ncbi:unnamed protein product (macronuclear) [Paramecium tetraurelia]|uniref:Transmembrane protein n=1 Tax=Paramecium tetraurelia TaxID=5888 RepID=A0BUM5_PARTE|nr:uncharacterized protein GSPATT00005488001 [Paramecium tetraurelia]CAK62242.1 unnamed protein product [Paramecium tetraurelia]|eukprot:XP_001429640.1 hypothetical protein (macronuclear) [Paramecium tetraurelia strain d4-2]
MDKNYQNVLALLPYGINIFILGRSKILRILIFTIIAGIQILIFLAIKPPSCHDIECPKIEKNYERILFYEKYNIQDDDLNLLRSEHFQQSYIINAFNFQLGVFLIIFPPRYYQRESMKKMINSNFSITLVDKQKIIKNTILLISLIFELFLIYQNSRNIIISLQVKRRYVPFSIRTNVEILRSSFNKFLKNRNRSQIKGIYHRLIEQQDILETKPEVSLFSIRIYQIFYCYFWHLSNVFVKNIKNDIIHISKQRQCENPLTQEYFPLTDILLSQFTLQFY